MLAGYEAGGKIQSSLWHITFTTMAILGCQQVDLAILAEERIVVGNPPLRSGIGQLVVNFVFV